MKTYVTVMAGGLGKRMKTPHLPKVLHKVLGVPMLVRVIQQACELDPENIMVIVGQYKPGISKVLKEFLSDYQYNKIVFVIQEVAKGTGHAIQCTIPFIKQLDVKNGVNIILSGDVPLITADTMKKMLSSFINKKNGLMQITCTEFDNPHGFGRIIKDKDEKFQKIVEHKDCNADQLSVKLCNAGIYVTSLDVLLKYLPKINNNNAQQEYYLTDLVEITLNYEKNGEIDLHVIEKDKQIELTGVNTIEQLNELNKSMANNASITE